MDAISCRSDHNVSVLFLELIDLFCLLVGLYFTDSFDYTHYLGHLCFSPVDQIDYEGNEQAHKDHKKP